MQYENFEERPLTVREKRALSEVKKQELLDSGKALSPIELKPREKIARSFWSKHWCENLMKYEDLDYRLQEGRKVLSWNALLDLQVEPLKLKALVFDSEVYNVLITFLPLDEEHQNKISEKLSGKLNSIYALLSGDLSDEVCTIITDGESGLFPKLDEIHFSCNCPDYASFCKHSASVLIGLSKIFDKDSALFFKLRDLKPMELLQEGILKNEITSNEMTKKETEDIFGIDLDL